MYVRGWGGTVSQGMLAMVLYVGWGMGGGVIMVRLSSWGACRKL